MKKKIVGIFGCMLLIVSLTIPIVTSIEKYNIKNNTEDYSSDEIQIGDDCGCIKTNKSNNRIEIIIEKPNPLISNKKMEKPTILDDLPDYFNWMDYEKQDWTTSAKDQHPCGSCQQFSAIGVLESIINIREGRADLDVDLSEQYVLSCLPRAGDCITGIPYNTFYYIMHNGSSGNFCNGIIPESCFPYKSIDFYGYNGEDYDNDPVLCDEKCENWEDYLIPISNCGYWYPEGKPGDIDAIKSQILRHGPVVTSFVCTWYSLCEENFIDWGWDNHDPDDYFFNPNQYSPNIGMGHFVVIVGWKDDPEISNGGYWICKNSWGQEFGYDGFFNIEYGTENIDRLMIEWVDYNPDVIVNWIPVSDTGGIYYGDIGEQLTFNGSNSFDHEGEIISYLWDFGDGYNQYDMTAVHAYESKGVYPVTLTVVDNSGNEVNDTTWAFIGRLNNPPETPTISGPLEGKIDIEYSINFSATDPEGDDVYFYVYWGDSWPIWYGPFPSGKEIKLNHTWTSKLSYTIRVKAKDEYGFRSNWTTKEIIIPKTKSNEHNINIFSLFYKQFPNMVMLLKIILKPMFERMKENTQFWR